MQFRRSLLAVGLVLFAMLGCAPEPTGPERGTDAGEHPPLAPSANTAELEALIRAKLTELASITPPDATAYQALFTNLLNVLVQNPDDVGGKLQTLLQFLDNHAGAAPDGSPAATLRDDLITLLYALVGLDPDATICILPANHSTEFCQVLDNGSPAGFVHFPQALFDQLTFVSVKSLGSAAPVGSGLDEYGYTIEVRTAPVSSFGQTLRPTVVTCVPQDLPDAVLDRLLLGHRRAADKYQGNPPFSLLPEAIDPEVADEAAAFCGEPESAPSSSGPSVFGLSVDSPLNRLLVSARSLFLPAELSASNSVLLATRGFSGASGSPEEFSTFRAVDRGVTGAGGSPEEFAPQATEGSPATGYQGAAGTSATTGLPHVIVQTPGGAGVAGVLVTFALSNPGGAGLTASQASLCLDQPATVATDANGMAELPCLSFGTLAGFKNLQVSFDPTAVLTGDGFLPGEQPCMIGAGGVCDNSVTANFLIETVAGPAATIEIVEGDNQTAPAYSAVDIAPKVVVKDQYGNVVSGAEVDWSANVGTIEPNLGADLQDLAQTATGTDGTSALTSWTLGVGANTLLAEITASGGIQSVTFNANGTFGLSLANACVTGGGKDDITKYGFHFPSENGRLIRAIGLHLSSNGAPGQSENYEVTLTATRTLKSGNSTTVEATRQATARLQSGSNSSKGIENLVVFDFLGNPFPVLPNGSNGTVTVTMTVAQIVDGVPQALPANRSVNMNVGGCPAGSKNCKPVKVAEARACSITESQLNPYIANYRNGLAARVYTSP